MENQTQNRTKSTDKSSSRDGGNKSAKKSKTSKTIDATEEKKRNTFLASMPSSKQIFCCGMMHERRKQHKLFDNQNRPIYANVVPSPGKSHTLSWTKKLCVRWVKSSSTEGTYPYWVNNPGHRAVLYVIDKFTLTSAGAITKMSHAKRSTAIECAELRTVGTSSFTTVRQCLPNVMRMEFIQKKNESTSAGAIILYHTLELSMTSKHQLYEYGTGKEGAEKCASLVEYVLSLSVHSNLSTVPTTHKKSYSTIATIYEKLKNTKVLVSRWDSQNSWVDEINASGGHYQKKYIALQIVEHIMFHLK